MFLKQLASLIGLLLIGIWFLPVKATALTPVVDELLVDEPHQCGSMSVHSTDGEALFLKGNGYGCLEGSGIVEADIYRGVVGVQGRGIVAYKADSFSLDGQWSGNTFTFMDWTFSIGSGSLIARGASYELIGWLSEGKVKFRADGHLGAEGSWASVYSDMVLVEESVQLDYPSSF